MILFVVLTMLFVKHYLADFIWQSDRMLKEKGIYGYIGGLQHSGFHAVLTYVILLHVLNIQACIILAVFDGLIHYHVDWAKVQLSSGLGTSDKKFWIWFGLDQLIHAMTYVGIVFIVGFLLME